MSDTPPETADITVGGGDPEAEKITVVISLTPDEWDKLAVIGKVEGLPLDKRIPLWLKNTVFRARKRVRSRSIFDERRD